MRSLTWARRYEDALKIAENYIFDSTNPFAAAERAEIALLFDKPEQALEYIATAGLPEHLELSIKAMALHDLGKYQESKLELQKLINLAVEDVRNKRWVAQVRSWTGDEEAALDYLYEKYWPHMIQFRRISDNTLWNRLHDHPRWRKLLEKSGYTPEAYAAVKFNVELPDED
jgi:hypothetical protein